MAKLTYSNGLTTFFDNETVPAGEYLGQRGWDDLKKATENLRLL